MKKISYILCGLLLILIASSSCKKNLLDSTPLNQYSSADTWKDSTLVTLYVSNIYAGMPSEYDAISSADMLGNYTDEATDNRVGLAPSYAYDQNQDNSSNAPFNKLWTNYYAQIRNCNVFLDNIATLNASAGLKNRLTGEVRFLRALYYHYLYNYFGDFPIIKKTLNTTDNLFIPRGSDADCINFITSELTAAADLLPVKYTGANMGRATKGAALALMCRTYLYAGQWQNAANAATAVMNLNTYSLFPDYGGIFYPQNEYNSEVILDKEYTPLAANRQYSQVDYYNSPGYFTGRSTAMNNPNGALVDAYEMTDGTTFSWSNPVEAASPWANRDPRLEASIIHDGSVLLGQTINMFVGSPYNNANFRASLTGYDMRKFVDPNYNPNQSTNNSGQNFIIIRYAEVLLNYAEAEFNLGNTTEALKYVNMIRARPSVNMPAITPANFTMDKLRHERFIELAFEGLRLWDINRWKIGPQTRGAASLTGITINGTLSGPISAHTYTPVAVNIGRAFDPKMYLFPIPYSEIIKYPGSSPLVQNPGW
jgi:hypothetical protein